VDYYCTSQLMLIQVDELVSLEAVYFTHDGTWN